MIDKKDVEKLANLSRLDISEEEKEIFIKDLDAILGYVSEVQEVVTEDIKPDLPAPACAGRQAGAGQLHNVMREDENPHKSGKFTKDILEEAPNTKDGYIKVKKIL